MPYITMPSITALPLNTEGLNWYQSLKVWLTTSRQWELNEDFEYYLPGVGTIIIPQGYIFDGASIPRIFRWFFSPVGILFIPSIVHDHGYEFKCVMVREEGTGAIVVWGEFNRKHWDDLFRRMAIETNGMKIINQISWAALRTSGSVAWNNHRKKEQTKWDS